MDQQLATQIVRRNCPRIWLVCKLYPSFVPHVSERAKGAKLGGFILAAAWQLGQSIGMEVKAQPDLTEVWGRTRSMQSQEAPSFVGREMGNT